MVAGGAGDKKGGCLGLAAIGLRQVGEKRRETPFGDHVALRDVNVTLLEPA